MTCFVIAILIVFLAGGCKSNSGCPAVPVVTDKQVKKTRKSAGKSYGLFSDKVNKSSGYKNRKATKKEKEKTGRE